MTLNGFVVWACARTRVCLRLRAHVCVCVCVCVHGCLCVCACVCLCVFNILSVILPDFNYFYIMRYFLIAHQIRRMNEIRTKYTLSNTYKRKKWRLFRTVINTWHLMWLGWIIISIDNFIITLSTGIKKRGTCLI